MEPSSYPRSEIVAVIKRHTHDVRNALNGMELELTLLDESATDPAVRQAVRRLRQAGAEISRLMQGLSSKYAMDPPSLIPAVQLAERWNADARHVAHEVPLRWNVQLGGELVCVDAGLVRSLLKDTLEMAVRIGGQQGFQINCRCGSVRAVFEIASEGGETATGISEVQQAYWAALRGLAERAQVLIEPATLSPHGSFPMRLSFPLHHPAT